MIKCRGIVMGGDAVCGILERRKSQHRVAVSHINPAYIERYILDPALVSFCPFGRIGDRLWIREQFFETNSGPVVYRADYPKNAEERGLLNIPPESKVKWRAAMFMPRAASRIMLEITSVRVEKLQSISNSDCEEEGISSLDMTPLRELFASRWDLHNERRGFAWKNDPWVWVIGIQGIGTIR